MWLKWSKVLVAQLCLTLCDPMNCSPLGSSVHGILQATILEWFAIPFSRESSQPRDRTWVSYIAGRFFTVWPTREASVRKTHLEFTYHVVQSTGLPSWLNSKESASNAGDAGSIPGLGRSEGGIGNPLQYSSLGNPTDRGAWWAIVHGIAKSQTRLSNWAMFNLCKWIFVNELIYKTETDSHA